MQQPPRAPAPAAVVVPVRSFEGAKSRLGAVLDAEERHDLVERLLARTVSAALGAPGVAEVVVVSPDPEVLDAAARLGARGVRQLHPGLNAALEEARDTVTAGRLLVLPGDLPGVTPGAVAEVLAAGARAGSPSVVVVPDRHGRGTNALLLDPPDVIETAFGGDSRAAHDLLAAASDAAHVELEGGPLALDLDTPDDLLEVERLVPEALGAG